MGNLCATIVALRRIGAHTREEERREGGLILHIEIALDTATGVHVESRRLVAEPLQRAVLPRSAANAPLWRHTTQLLKT